MSIEFRLANKRHKPVLLAATHIGLRVLTAMSNRPDQDYMLLSSLARGGSGGAPSLLTGVSYEVFYSEGLSQTREMCQVLAAEIFDVESFS